MKEKLKKYLFEYYRNRLLDYYIAIFEDVTLYCDVSEHCSHTVTRIIWDLRSKIRCAMITDSYDLDIIEEAFDVALKI